MTVRAMGTSVWEQGPAWVAENFDSVNPATSEVIGTYPVQGRSEVDAVVGRARQAASWWAGLTYQQRRTRLLAWKSHITRYLARLAELVHNETGKPLADAQLEILLAIMHIDWAAKNARRVLGSRRVRSGLIAINQASRLEYQPLGVIGVIGPWNYPVFTPLGSIVYALAAGNAVVFKPSELTPAVGGWLVNSFAEVVPEQPVLQLVTGSGETGQALALSAVDKIAFTGSAAMAKKVMAACAENLTPLVAECGGKDALLVGADADLDAAADAAAWGALSNAGQTCVGVERVYVVDEVYHTFLEKLAERAAAVRPGEDREADYGPMTMPGQIEIIERHIADALARGGRPVVGGLASIRRPYVGPVILADVPEESRAVSEETFGPTLTVTRVGDLDEAVRLANASRYALGLRRVQQERQARTRRGAGPAHRDDVDQLGHHVRQRAHAAFRRERRLRLRPDPRRGRPARVLPGQGDHPPVDAAAGGADHAPAQREGPEPCPPARHPDPRQALPLTLGGR